MRRARCLLAILLLAGCGGSEDASDGAPKDRESAPAPPPDAGVAQGHGADATTVTVPRRDATPPTSTIVLRGSDGKQLGTASQPPSDEPATTVRLDQPRFEASTIGRDDDGGVARVRISIKQHIRCGDGEAERRVRYYPPPQTERIRSNPGARLPTEETRTRPIELQASCEVTGELWGEAINGSGLEAVTPHVRFAYPR